jgi:hypothetical protein
MVCNQPGLKPIAIKKDTHSASSTIQSPGNQKIRSSRLENKGKWEESDVPGISRIYPYIPGTSVEG